MEAGKVGGGGGRKEGITGINTEFFIRGETGMGIVHNC